MHSPNFFFISAERIYNHVVKDPLGPFRTLNRRKHRKTENERDREEAEIEL
jgi:hypothetical protein